MALEQQPQLDLSCVRHMINAAEPVDTASIDRFYAVFEAHGLKRCRRFAVGARVHEGVRSMNPSIAYRVELSLSLYVYYELNYFKKMCSVCV